MSSQQIDSKIAAIQGMIDSVADKISKVSRDDAARLKVCVFNLGAIRHDIARGNPGH